MCEIWDEYVSRSIGGCTYHVSHPGGRNYTTFPVNAYEAEGRRLARFEPFGYTPGVFVPPAATPNPDFPHTLESNGGANVLVSNAAPLFGEEALGRYDELIDGAGTVRPHWQRLAAAFAAMGNDEYRHRIESATRMVRENGVTYNAYDEASGLDRLWQLDIAPFVVSADDWAIIEAAAAQRARLADAILHDLYSEQRLLRDGIVPPHLVLGHPQYLRALQGVMPPGGVHVHLYSMDIARMPNGSWTVHASRADAPTGLGYALENRVVVSQTFPELFGDLGVQRLATFFPPSSRCGRELGRRRHRSRGAAHAGPYNEAYFEHAYLARYLNLELVEGDDLSVRDGLVYLRTLGGLERVSVIFRRLDSNFADPLELARRFRPRRSGSRGSDSSRQRRHGRTRSAAASSNRRPSTRIFRTSRARCSAKSCSAATSPPSGAARRGAAPKASRACVPGSCAAHSMRGRFFHAARRPVRAATSAPTNSPRLPTRSNGAGPRWWFKISFRSVSRRRSSAAPSRHAR